jgi:hypothetical protein
MAHNIYANVWNMLYPNAPHPIKVWSLDIEDKDVNRYCIYEKSVEISDADGGPLFAPRVLVRYKTKRRIVQANEKPVEYLYTRDVSIDYLDSLDAYKDVITKELMEQATKASINSKLNLNKHGASQ